MLMRIWRNWVIYAMLIGRHYQVVQPLWKRGWHFLAKLNMPLPSDPAIPLLSIYPRKINLHPNDPSGLICNSSKLDITQMSFNRQILENCDIGTPWNTTQQ